MVQWYIGVPFVHWYSGAMVQWCSGTVVQWCIRALVQWCTGTVSVPGPGQEAADVKATWFTLSVPGLGVKQKQIVSTFLCSPLILVKVKFCLYQL